jgi:branched-subunit amino acid ABC-type transport system permease component
MSESRVLVLLFASACAVGGVAGVVLTLAHASGVAYGLTIFTGAALGGYVSPLVLTRYDQLRQRQEREELILSR